MSNLDLRQIGTVIGLPVYIDVAGVHDFKDKSDVISERDRKVMMAGMILRRAFELSDEQIKAMTQAHLEDEDDH